MKEFQFDDIYSMVSLIDRSVQFNVGFFNHNKKLFASASINYSKHTLLHLYILNQLYNYHHRYFRKNPDCLEEEEMDRWISLFQTYKVKIKPLNIGLEEEAVQWMDNNKKAFFRLFCRMSEEAFHILFQNRNFLLKFNQLVAEEVHDTKYPPNIQTLKGTLKRVSIPKWTQAAVFHRDKGHCIYCNRDLTGIINIMTNKNFDHMVPLDLYGANDPCNLQLACENCNKRKSNKAASTTFKYQPWWPI